MYVYYSLQQHQSEYQNTAIAVATKKIHQSEEKKEILVSTTSADRQSVQL